MAENVLILGAGASAHYNFPLARALVQSACLRDWEGAVLSACGLDVSALERFVADLKRSGTTSIDQYIGYLRNTATINLGKALIAYLLAKKEDLGELTRPGHPYNWYEALASRLIGPALESFPEHNIAIVTFNYDRSLEQYLFDALTSRFNQQHDTNKIREAFLRLPIIHIYGQLGSLPELGVDSALARPYGPIATPEGMARAVNSMHLLPEIRKAKLIPNSGTTAARECISNATRTIAFLGFAYSQENLEALDLAKTRGSKRVCGTLFGIDGEQVDEVRERLGRLDVSLTAHWPYTVYQAVTLAPITLLGKHPKA
jgi:hypothetical protein